MKNILDFSILPTQDKKDKFEIFPSTYPQISSLFFVDNVDKFCITLLSSHFL